VNEESLQGRTPLHMAARGGHTEAVSLLLSRSADVNKMDEDGRTASHLAAFNGHAETVQVLASSQTDDDLEKRDNQGCTVLHLASANGSAATVKLLLDRGAEREEKENQGYTPLHLSSMAGHREVVLQLLLGGASSNMKDKQGHTALHWAALNNHSEIVSLLLKSHANVDEKDNCRRTALHLATLKGNIGVVVILLANNAMVDSRNELGRTPLMEAALFGRLEIVQALVQNGANLNLHSMEESTQGRIFSTKHPLTARDFARDDTTWAANERAKYFPDYTESNMDLFKRRRIVSLLTPNSNGLLNNPSPVQNRRLTLGLHRNLVTNQTEIVEHQILGITDKDKAVAILDRGPQYPRVVAVSGWAYHFIPSSESTTILSNSFWTRNVLRLAYELEGSMRLPHPIVGPNLYDRGIRGVWEACHAEKQLMVFYLYEYHIRQWDPITDRAHQNQIPQCVIQVNKEPCPSCIAFRDIIKTYFNIEIRIELRLNG
jgi:ankyrin repeat protein